MSRLVISEIPFVLLTFLICFTSSDIDTGIGTSWRTSTNSNHLGPLKAKLNMRTASIVILVPHFLRRFEQKKHVELSSHRSGDDLFLEMGCTSIESLFDAGLNWYGSSCTVTMLVAFPTMKSIVKFRWTYFNNAEDFFALIFYLVRVRYKKKYIFQW